ncbi:MAG: FtsX-like permease family protein, partial [Pseudomonadota bacterium]
IENHRDHMENQIENHRDHMENQIENQRDQIENQRDHMENRALNYENVINSIQHWSQQYVSFFNMLMLESRIMKIVILMIVCIFALLIVVSIVLIIYEKKKDIAVLISAGMTRWQVASVFCLIGVYICILSSILGCILGYVILTNFSIILSCLEYFLGGIYDISIGIDFIFPYIEMFYIIMSMVILNIFMVLIVSYIMFNRSLHMIIRG